MPGRSNAAVRVEVAVDGVAGAHAAIAAGAARLELCQCLERGGLTPSTGLLAAVAAAAAPANVPVVAMVRPRAGDFVFADGELDVMRRDVDALRAAGAAGIVTGVLRPDGTIDAQRMRELVAAAAPLPVTCHRALDHCADLERELDVLLQLGVARVLTSGGAPTAAAGAGTIAALVRRAAGRIDVIAGGGVTAANAAALVAATGVREVHLSATVWIPSSMTFRRRDAAVGYVPPDVGDQVRATDGALVARVVAALRPD